MGLLNGGLAGVFGAAFGGLYLDGYLRTVAQAFDTDGSVKKTPVSKAIRLQVDGVTESMRQEAGYSAEDARILILQRNGLGETVSKPTLADRIEHDRRAWKVGSVNSDPAATYWEVRATPCDLPKPGR